MKLSSSHILILLGVILVVWAAIVVRQSTDKDSNYGAADLLGTSNDPYKIDRLPLVRSTTSIDRMRYYIKHCINNTDEQHKLDLESTYKEPHYLTDKICCRNKAWG